jgi:hypothetical protein
MHNFRIEILDLKLCIDGLYPFISSLASQKYIWFVTNKYNNKLSKTHALHAKNTKAYDWIIYFFTSFTLIIILFLHTLSLKFCI